MVDYVGQEARSRAKDRASAITFTGVACQRLTCAAPSGSSSE